MSDILKDFTKWFGKLRFKKETYVKEGIRPERHWLFILVSSFVLIIFMTGFAYYFYIMIDQGKLFFPAEPVPSKTVQINNQWLKQVINEANVRQEYLNGFKQNRAIPADPSL